MVSLRPARAADVVKVTRIALPRFIGVVVEEDGETIGIGLIMWVKRRPILTFDKTERMRQLPRIMIRIARDLARAGAQACGELYVMQDSREEGSARWLERIGFRPTDEMISGERVWKLSR